VAAIADALVERRIGTRRCVSIRRHGARQAAHQSMGRADQGRA
jgi:hypothetical protein